MVEFKIRLKAFVQTEVTDMEETECATPGWEVWDAYVTDNTVDPIKVTVELEKEFVVHAQDEDAAFEAAKSLCPPIEIAGHRYLSHYWDLLEAAENTPSPGVMRI